MPCFARQTYFCTLVWWRHSKDLNQIFGSIRISLQPTLRQREFSLWDMRDAECQKCAQRFLRLRRTDWAACSTGGVDRAVVGRIALKTRNGWLSLHLLNSREKIPSADLQRVGIASIKTAFQQIPATARADQLCIGRYHGTYDGMREYKHVAYDILNAGQTRRNPVC